MDFDAAKQAHMAWKTKILDTINGTAKETFDPKVVGTDNACALGKWIYGEGAAFSSLPEYPELVKLHAEFHKVASSILLKTKTDPEGAKKDASDISGPLMLASGKVILLINRIKDKVK